MASIAPTCILEAEAGKADVEEASDLNLVEEEEGEEYGLQPQALEVVDGDVDLTDTTPPATAEEYLRRVRHEARSSPKVLVAKQRPPAVSETQQRRKPAAMARSSLLPNFAAAFSSPPPPPSHAAARVEWQRRFIASFSRLRADVASEIERGNGEGGGRGGVPSMKDPQSWKRYVVEDGNEPTLVLLRKLGETRISLLLRYAVSWLEEDTGKLGAGAQEEGGGVSPALSVQMARWLFALCASVGKPLDSDTSAALRSMLRNCCILRSRTSSADDASLPILNILITIAGEYFHQRDPSEREEDAIDSYVTVNTPDGKGG